MKIAIYAFTTTARFYRELIRLTAGEADLEWSVIVPRGHHLDVLEGAVPADRLCYLYEDFNARHARSPDPDFTSLPASADNLYTALLKDKDGYRHLDKDEQLRRAAVIYGVYKDFLLRVRPQFLLTPDVETVDGFILLGLCAELGIEPIYLVGMRVLEGLFFSPTCHEDLPSYFGSYDEDDLTRARALLDAVRERGLKGIGGFYAPPATASTTVKPRPLLLRAPKSMWLSWTKERLHAGEDNLALRVKTSIKPVLYRYRKARFVLRQARYFDLRADLHGLPERFVFYALQYTPESSINGLSPYYIDQLRVIDRLLLSLPAGFRLVVKEHPAIAGIRTNGFYRALRRRPGIVLVHPALDTHAIVARAALVATVTGTIGLECFFLDKPCLLFGPNFFAHLCYRFTDWCDRPDMIAAITADFRPRSDEEKTVALARLLHIRYDLHLTGPLSNASDLSPPAIEAYWAAVRDHIRRRAANEPR